MEIKIIMLSFVENNNWLIWFGTGGDKRSLISCYSKGTVAGWIKLRSEPRETLILFVEISVRNTHLCTHAYDKRNKWAEPHDKNMNKLLNNEGIISKIVSYCSYVMETQKVTKKNKINHMKRALRSSLRTEKTNSSK